jgi:hypothetical protein
MGVSHIFVDNAQKILTKRCPVMGRFDSSFLCLELSDSASVLMTWKFYLARLYSGVLRDITI